jgi:hypothetical protein
MDPQHKGQMPPDPQLPEGELIIWAGGMLNE